MKFIKQEAIVLKGQTGKDLPQTVPGYKAGIFSIHTNKEPGFAWVVSANGVKLMDCVYFENAKKAAKAFAALPIDWTQKPQKIVREVRKQHDLLQQVATIKTTYALRKV